MFALCALWHICLFGVGQEELVEATKQQWRADRELSAAKQENKRLRESLEEAEQKLPELREQLEEHHKAKAKMAVRSLCKHTNTLDKAQILRNKMGHFMVETEHEKQ